MPYEKDTKKRKVQRLVDVEVSHVSLVDRPANMTPFKAVKREDKTPKGVTPMNVTLKNLFGSRPAAVLSVLAATEAKSTAVAKMLIEGEFEVTETDGLFVARKSGVPASEDEQIVHLGKSAGVAYSVGNLRKGLAIYDMESDNFDDALTQEGFVPGIYLAMEALNTTIRNIAMSDEVSTPEMFASKVSEAIDDFKKYMNDMIGALPEKAFKFEKALMVAAPNALKNPTPHGEGFNTAVYDAIFGPEADEEAAPVDDKGPKEVDTGETPAPAAADASADKEATPAPAPVEEVTAGGDPKEEAPEVDAAPANLEELPKSAPETQAASQEEIMASMLEALTKTVGASITAAMEPMTARLDAQDEAIKKMTKAVGGAVLSAPDQDGDDQNVIELSKGVRTGEPPLMDTAYAAKRG